MGITVGVTSSVVDVLQDQHRRIADLFTRVSSPDEDRPAVLHALIRELTGHVAAERGALTPALHRHGVDEELSSRLDDDHARVEKLMVLIERRKFNSPDVPDLVNELKAASDEHADRAQRDLFPALTEKLTFQEQKELGEQLLRTDGMVTSHPHPHLLSLGPLADVLTRVASWWDRARDRTAINRGHPEDHHKVHVTKPAQRWAAVRGGDPADPADPGDPVEDADPSMGGAT